MTEAGLPPAACAAWMHAPQPVLEGRTPDEVLREAEDEGSILDRFALVIGAAAGLKHRPCGRTDPLEEDGRCGCGGYHLGDL